VPLWIEYEATLERDRIAAAHGLSFGEIDSLLDAWAVHVDPVELHYTWRPQLRDPKDEMVLQTALNGRCEALVTFNEADFAKAARKLGMPVWNPRDLLRRLETTR